MTDEKLALAFGCPECGAEAKFCGTGTAMRPGATAEDYLRGLFAGEPPTQHINFWYCENDHRWQEPTAEEIANMWKMW